jgi:hypothetical protein
MDATAETGSHSASSSSAFATLEANLRQRLSRLFSPAERREIIFTFSVGRDAMHVMHFHPAQPMATPDTLSWPLGCNTKLLTSALTLEAVRAGAFQLDEPVMQCLRLPRRAQAHHLEGITPRHLLEHAHGLDDSALGGQPLRCDGFLDLRALLARLGAHRPVARPGEIVNYGNGGPWLISAVLERHFGKPYSQLLHERLTEPFGLYSTLRNRNELLPSAICPSMGRQLRVTAAGMARFLHTKPLRDVTSVTAYPGWGLFEQGIALGWKSMGGGWFGHNSIWPVSSMIRVLPEKDVVIVLMSRKHRAGALSTRLFTSLLPETSRPPYPPALSPEELAALPLQRYVGRYGNANLDVRISIQDGQLCVTTRVASAGAPVDYQSPLRARKEHLFLQETPGAPFSFLQFLPAEDASPSYIWTGNTVWRRLEPDSFAGRNSTTA